MSIDYAIDEKYWDKKVKIKLLDKKSNEAKTIEMLIPKDACYLRVVLDQMVDDDGLHSSMPTLEYLNKNGQKIYEMYARVPALYLTKVLDSIFKKFEAKAQE
jgi:hypothetical protein